MYCILLGDLPVIHLAKLWLLADVFMFSSFFLIVLSFQSCVVFLFVCQREAV